MKGSSNKKAIIFMLLSIFLSTDLHVHDIDMHSKYTVYRYCKLRANGENKNLSANKI